MTVYKHSIFIDLENQKAKFVTRRARPAPRAQLVRVLSPAISVAWGRAARQAVPLDTADKRPLRSPASRPTSLGTRPGPGSLPCAFHRLACGSAASAGAHRR